MEQSGGQINWNQNEDRNGKRLTFMKMERDVKLYEATVSEEYHWDVYHGLTETPTEIFFLFERKREECDVLSAA